MSTETTQNYHRKGAARIVENYVRVQEETTPPDQVILLLLDGVAKFITTARSQIQLEEFEEKNAVLVKGQTILKELMDALDPAIGEAAYRNLRGLYFFVYRRLVEANVQNDEKSLDEAAQVLGQLRETWGAAIEEYRKSLRESAEAAKTDAQEGDEEPVVSLSVEG